MSKYVFHLNALGCMALASSTAMAKAINEQLHLVKTHGDLTGIAKLCSVISGGGLDPTVDWKTIRPRHAALTKDYFHMLMTSVGHGPLELLNNAKRLASWRDAATAQIHAKFAAAAKHNDRTIQNAMIGFQSARAVRITALGTLALLSGVGGVVGAGGTITAFGVETGMVGLSFSQGLLFGVGSKAAYNVATNWNAKPGAIVAVVVSNGITDGVQPLAQEAAQIGLELAFYEQLRTWAKELRLGQEAQSNIDLLQRRLANQLKKAKPNPKDVAKLERQIAKKSAEQLQREGAQKSARLGQKVLGGLPVVWLAQDLWGIYGEAANDMNML